LGSVALLGESAAAEWFSKGALLLNPLKLPLHAPTVDLTKEKIQT